MILGTERTDFAENLLSFAQKSTSEFQNQTQNSEIFSLKNNEIHAKSEHSTPNIKKVIPILRKVFFFGKPCTKYFSYSRS